MVMVLIINSILLITVTVVFSVAVSRQAGVRSLITSGISGLNEEINERRLRRLIRKYKHTVSIRISISEKVELYLIDKSNIRRYIPFMSFNFLLVVCLLIFILVFQPIYRVLYFIPSAVVISLIAALSPVLVLDLMGRYNSEVIRRRLAEFISILNRWYAVKEDIFYAFEKSVESGIGEPLQTFIRDMVIQVSRGIEPLEALEMLQLKVDSPQFRDFITNIKQNIRYRGDVRKLLTNLENQFYKIEEEYNRRKISTYKDRLIIFIVMFAVLIIGYYFLKLNPAVEAFYLETVQGKSILTLFSILYAGGLYLSFKITSFKH